MREALAAAVLLCAIGLLATLRPTRPRMAPEPRPVSACAVWMADAIPGVGAKTRAAVAERIRSGQVPPAAAGWFTHESTR